MAKGIYRRGNILWIAYVGPDGKVIRESSKSSKVKDAETLLTKRRRAVLDGKIPEIKRIANYSFKQLADDYLKWAERQRAYAQKKLVIDQLKERFGTLPLRRFDTRMIEGYQSERLLAGKPNPKTEEVKANKPATINRHIATLKHMFTKAVEWDMVEEDIMKRIRRSNCLRKTTGDCATCPKKNAMPLFRLVTSV